MTNESKPGTFTAKDYFSIIFSVIALAISGTNFYYSNVRIDENVKARFYIAYLEPESSDSIETGTIKVALFNMGNRQATIVNVVFEFTASLSDTAHYIIGNSFDNFNEFPFILQPHETKMVDLKLAFKTDGTITLNNSYNGKRKQKIEFKEALLKLRFIALDSKAELHGATMENCKIDIALREKQWYFERYVSDEEILQPEKNSNSNFFTLIYKN